MNKGFIFRAMRVGRGVLASAVLLFCTSMAWAQVTGTRTIGVDYPTLAAAITDLNTVGISGPVTINIPAGYTETAPAGGYLLGTATLNASTSAASTLTFQKTGAGTDPLLTAPVGTSTTVDGIFTIQGTDYVTINGIDLTESAANTTPTTWMEWGYGLVKLQNTAPFDGCQNVTIQNCTITLNILNTPSVGIYANNHIATSTTALAITAATDAMNNCRFYSNTVQNCNTGISLRGFAAAASPYTLYDQNNDIGGSSAATANTIQNYAGATAGSGINLRYQNNTNVAYNIINNTAGGGVPATNTVYGVYAQNGTNSSTTITNNTVTLAQGTTGSSLYGVNIAYSGTGTINVNSNQFTANGGTTGSMYMIYLGSANTNVNTNSNNFYNINVATSGSLYFVYHSTAATTANITCSNNFTSGPATPYVSKTGSGGTFAGYYNNAGSSGGFASINNNNFSYISLAGSPTFYGINETNGGSGQNKFLRNNIISNITTTAGGTLYGLRIGYTATANFANNTVSSLNAGTGSAYGIYLVSGTTDTVMNNSIHDLTSTGGNLYGIYLSGGTTITIFQDTVHTLATSGTTGLGYGIWQGSGTTVNIYQNKIYDVAASGTGSSVNGMYLNSGVVTVYNNIVGDLRTPNYSGAGGTQLVGIYLGGGSAYYAYYNTVYVNGTSTGTDFGSCAVFSSSTPPVTLVDNIFVNTSTPNGAGITVAYRRSSATLTTYQAASNNNLFYAGTPGPANVIFYDGTTTYPTLGAFKALVAPRDGNSVTENPPFASTVGSAANYLHISTSVPTQIESGGVNITGITGDIDGIIRAGNPGYLGSGSAPDIGASEGNYLSVDLTAPNIIYTLLPNSCTTGDRTLTASITDASGVPVSGTLVPRIYFKKGAGPWQSTAGTLTSGTATSGTWSFTISSAALGGLAIGDVVSYFVIAQDIVATPNIGSNPPLGLVATDVNTITSYPTTPNTYNVLPTLSGSYNVGVGMAYTTITDAVNAFNTSCVSGPVVFLLTDAAYGAAETFPITINSNVSSSSVNTLTIKPAAGIAATITGITSSPALFKFLNAKYVTIDGVNAGGSSLTLNNTNTGTSAAIWLASAAGIGNSNIALKNMNINGGSNTTANDWAILSGADGAAPSTTTGADNDNITILGNAILKSGYGIYANGTSALSAGGLDNWTISNNIVGPSSYGSTDIGYNGIFLGNALNAVITGNVLQYIGYTSGSQTVGINLTSNVNGFTLGQNNINNVKSSASVSGTGSNTGIYLGSNVINGTVTRNYVTSIANSSTGGYGVRGIIVNTGAAASNVTISDNMISDIWCYADANFIYDPVGIDVDGSCGGVNLYDNSINLFGSHTGYSTGTTYAADVYINTTGSNLNIVDNILVNAYDNSSSSTDKSYSIYAASGSPATYSSIDYNDYYVYAPTGVLAYLGSDQLTLAALQAAFGSNTHSLNMGPLFVSSTDLHLQVDGTNAPLVSGIPIAGITVDIDGTPRGVTTTVIGAHEVNIPLCASVTAGTVTPTTSAFCASGSTVLNLTGATAGVGISYQWESSADSASWTTIGGATTASYTTPVITTTTYYRVVLRCFYSGLADSATTKVTIHPLPVISVTPDGGGICTLGSGLSMTASGASSYSWSPSGGLSGISGATVVASPSVTTTYVVSGTDTFGCVNTHASTVVVTISPSVVMVSPSSATFCSGGSQSLTATSTITGPGTPLSLDFNSGLGSWTIDNTGTGSPYPDVTWTVHADGFTNELGTYHSPDHSAFISTNSDTSGSGITVHSILTSPSFSLVGYTAATLTFQHAYEAYFSDAIVDVEISTDGGLTWPVLQNYLGTSFGSTTSFINASIDLSPYLGMPSLMIRYNYQSVYGYYWALDNIAVSGTQTLPVTSITWAPTAGLYTDAALTTPYTGTATTTVYAAPTAPTVATVNTYMATATNGTCTDTGSSVITVNPLPFAGAITGPSSVCAGSSITLTDATTGGVWTVSNASATVSGGIVTGVTAGVDTVTYSVTNSCGTATTTQVVTVNPLPVSGSISGSTAVCVGSSVSLSDAATGGVWSSASPSIATVTSTGSVTGVSAGTVVISYSVTNICGTAVATTIATVNPLPVAGTISGASSVCVGSSTPLTDASPGGIWSSGSVSAFVSPSGLVTGVAVGTATISYSVTNVCGTATATMVITINPLPSAGVITGPSTVCVGSSIVLTDPAPGGSWTSSDVTASVAGGVVTGISAGTTIISYTVTNGCGTAFATQLITIDPLPDAGTISGSSTVCIGSSVALSDAAPGGVWTSSNPSATVSPSGVVTGVSTGSPIISYTVTNSCGTISAIFPMAVDPLPTVFNVIGGGTICAGSAGVDVGLDGSTPGVTYQLYDSSAAVGIALGGSGGPLDFGPQTGAGTYSVLATSAAGCSAAMAGAAVVIVNPTTPPSVSISTGMGDTVCASTMVTFTPVPVNGGATPSYVWSVNGLVVSASTSYSYFPANGDVVSVMITSSSCASPDTASSSVTMTVTPFIMPSVTIVPSTVTDTTCAGYDVTFTAIPVNGGSTPGYRWTVNGVNVATGPTFTYTPSEGDSIYVMMGSSSHCILADSVFSNTIVMHTAPVLVPSILVNAVPGLSIAAGTADTFTATAYSAGPSPTYQWQVNSVPVAGATNAVFISSSLVNGDVVSCYVTSSGLCYGITSYVSVSISTYVTGVGQIAAGTGDVRVVPNPNKGTFTIKGTLGLAEDQDVSIEVTDMLGQVIYKDKVLAKKGQLSQLIDLGNTLANGMYILNASTATEHFVFHFVVEE